MPLATKIQYKNFEPGEFVEHRLMTYEGTIALIEKFPWNEQRDQLHVDLTSPSITIKDNEGNYLKLALYYEGKFVLYYLDTDNLLFTKSLAHYQDAYPYLNAFYSGSSFDTGDFKKENNWIRGKISHFQDRSFEYSINEIKFWVMAILTCGIMLTMAISITALLILTPKVPQIVFIAIFVLILVILMGITLAVMINNYRVARSKILIMSKGSPAFYYGEEAYPEKFDKRSISNVTSMGPYNGRNTSVGYVKIEMGPKPGRILYIPNLVIDETTILDKLSGYPVIQKNKWFPFIPSASSVPS